MEIQRLPSERLQWKYNSPLWPREPDINIVKLLAKSRLIGELPTDLDDDLLEVSFFKEGGFNKVYQVSYTKQSTAYLFRVALPAEPYFKTESEVATIAFLRAKASIPVPRVYALDSSSDNELTFEWILMEKLDGVPLGDVWHDIPWERKLELTENIAGMVKQMQDHKFEQIGGLYFSSAWDRNVIRPSTTSESALSVTDLTLAEPHPDDTTLCGDIDNERGPIKVKSALDWVSAPVNEIFACLHANVEDDQTDQMTIGSLIGGASDFVNEEVTKSTVGSPDRRDFSIGRMFDQVFFMASNLYLPGDRGPFQSCLEWLKAAIEIQLE